MPKKEKTEPVSEKKSEESKSPMKRALAKHYIIGFAIVCLIIAAVPSVYFYHQYQSVKGSSAQPTQAQQLIERVGNLIDIPTETPTIATVSDISKLASQPFFAHAHNGDKVLIFQNAKEAILYRPSENKLIQVGSINVGATAQNSAAPQVAGAAISPSATPTITPTPFPVKVVIYNGTKTAGLAASAGKLISQKLSNVTVTGTGNAQNDYTKTIVVDLLGNQENTAQQIADVVNGSVVAFPSGETKPQADILVIVGTDYK
jgi:LytR cell envelope-related transcriptional attenuator